MNISQFDEVNLYDAFEHFIFHIINLKSEFNIDSINKKFIIILIFYHIFYIIKQFLKAHYIFFTSFR